MISIPHILILIVLAGQQTTPAVHSQSFASKAACEAALADITKQATGLTSWGLPKPRVAGGCYRTN